MVQFNYQTRFKLKHITRIKKLIDVISRKETKTISNISIVFTSDEYLLQLNKDYLHHDYFTDIITFDYSNTDDGNIEGELFISVERASENSKLYNVSTQNEVLRLIIHGVLHLMGYNDKNELLKAEMTQKENEYLALF